MTHSETTPATPEGDAISRALPNAYYECAGCTQQGSESNCRAQSAPVGGEVKALVWSAYENEGSVDHWDAEAGRFGVFYNIEVQVDGFRVVFDHEAVGAIGAFPSLEAAKAAAQADYEARILSALQPGDGWQNGQAAKAMLAHYAQEVRPHAEARGMRRQDVREAALVSVGKVFDEAWPASLPQGEETR